MNRVYTFKSRGGTVQHIHRPSLEEAKEFARANPWYGILIATGKLNRKETERIYGHKDYQEPEPKYLTREELMTRKGQCSHFATDIINAEKVGANIWYVVTRAGQEPGSGYLLSGHRGRDNAKRFAKKMLDKGVPALVTKNLRKRYLF